MATNSSANSNSASQSPRQSGGGDTIGSPQSRRGGRPVSSPWTQIVRGESEPTTIGGAATPSSSTAAIEPAVTVGLVVEEAISESSENGPNGNGGRGPPGTSPRMELPEVGPVMGAVSWPALSESTRPPSKSSPDSFKPLSDGSSVLVSQGTGATSSAAQKQVSNNVNPSSTSNNHSVSTRPRSMKRNNTSTSSNGGLPQQQVPPVPAVEMASNNPLPKDHTHRSGFASHSGNDHPQHRNSFRGRNGGSHPRGDGSHHHNYGNRRDQERGNQDWGHRNFTGRDTHMQTPRGVPRYIRPPPPPPPPSSAPFIQPVRHFGSPIGFPELPPTVLYGMPFVPLPPPAVFFSAPDLQLHTKIVNQIDYYFSNENLIKDTYLRQNMDDQGWVPIKLIARFNKVMHLTENIQLILDAVRTSNVLEVQGDKVRRRGDWMRWIMPASVQFPKTLGNSSLDTVAGQVQSMALEENTTNHNNSRGPADVHAEGFPSGLPSEDLSSQLQLSGGEGTAQVGIQAGSARN